MPKASYSRVVPARFDRAPHLTVHRGPTALVTQAPGMPRELDVEAVGRAGRTLAVGPPNPPTEVGAGKPGGDPERW